MSYRELTSTEAVDALLAQEEPVWVFKHSQICGISHAAKEQVDAYCAEHDDPVGIVVIQEHRPVSNHIAERLGRVHQSPQLFLVHGGAVQWAATHYSITKAAMAEARAEVA